MQRRHIHYRFLLVAAVASGALAAGLAVLCLRLTGGQGLPLVLLAAGNFVAVSLLLAWWLAGWISKPLGRLADEAHHIGAGEFDRSIRSDRDDEIGELAAALEAMRMRLRETTISRDYLDQLLASMRESVLVTNEEGEITRCNPAASELLGLDQDRLEGRQLSELFADTVRAGMAMETLARGQGESVLVNARGEEVPVSYSTAEISTADPRFKGYVVVARNISDRKLAERRIRYLARFDALTRVPNRMHFQHLMQRMLARARKAGQRTALLYIDLDRFKEINDTYGHLAGDRCLEAAADRLTSLLPTDCIVGRLAGDEFGVLVNHQLSLEETRRKMAALADELIIELTRPYYYEHLEIFLAASIGIAIFPDDASNVIDLIRNADAAMYQAKRNGGNQHEFYRPELNLDTQEQLMLKGKLRRALERSEFLVRYQPKIDVRDGRIVGAEALLRWRLPGRGEIEPAEFIPLAEESSLILDIGDWVLKRVCEDYRSWREAAMAPGRIAVNLSLRQLRQKDLVEHIAAVLEEEGISPTCIEFEITESTLMEDPVTTVASLNRLYAMGVHLAIDDFGTGYSSLSSLQQFPITTLKIDQSFVQDADVNRDDATIVSTIIEMGRSLNMDVVAEGVETQAQLDFLRRLKCNYIQGHLIAGPLKADDFLELLRVDLDGSGRHRALFAAS